MKTSPYTPIGLLISYFSITALSIVFANLFGEQLTSLQAIARELLIFGCVGILFFIILKKEKLTLNSIGLHNRHWGKSMLYVLIGLLFSIGGIALSLWLCQLLGWEFGTSTAFDKLSPLAIFIIVLRAGIAEEVFMRGYIFERLTGFFNNKWAAALLSTIPFALLHYKQGYAGILISFVLGAILMGMYMWKRDLKSNIITHFTIDFVPNLLLAAII